MAMSILIPYDTLDHAKYQDIVSNPTKLLQLGRSVRESIQVTKKADVENVLNQTRKIY
jgi:hypothetical protein